MRPPPLSRLHRIYPLLRPFRPPSARSKTLELRLFSQNSQLLLVTPASPRPQLPFLTASNRRVQQRGGQWQLSRLLTTERKRYLKDQLWLAGKYTLFGYTGIALLLLVAFGVQNEWLERKYPSPHEWTMWSRMNYRSARWNEEPDANGTGMTDWARTGNMYRQVIARLENREKDGKGIEDVDEGGILVEGVGRAGVDISAKPESWRRGYFEAIMGAARAAEHLDGWVRDTTRNIAFPGDVVIGPDNPNPKPVPPGAYPAPLQENCVVAFEPPEQYYLKILTTRGFLTRQKLAAAIAYADWLDFKGLSESAEEMYKWGLDIAASSHPEGGADDIDRNSGVIREHPTHVSDNLFLATTSLAIHHARNNNLSAALPIFLSILRARRSLPPAQPSRPKIKPAETSSAGPMLLIHTLISFIKERPFPPPGPSGEETPFRTPAEICEEAGIMAYIGEVLFASFQRGAGLSWTRDSVDLAEEVFTDTSGGEGGERCRECLEVGLGNWQKMVAAMVKEEKEKGTATKGEVTSWRSWLSSTDGAKGADGEMAWEREKELVEERRKRVRQLLLMKGTKKSSDSSSGMIFG